MKASPAVAVALAAFFAAIQFYTSLAALSPTPPVGYVFAGRSLAALLAGALVVAAAALAVRLVRDRVAPPGVSRAMLGAWIGAVLVASLFGFSVPDGVALVGVMVLAGIFHLGVVAYFARPGVGHAVVVTYLWTGLVSSAAGLAMAAIRRPGALWALNHGRAAGFFVTANQFAAFLIAFVFVAVGAALSGDSALRRLGAASAGIGFAALLATVSIAGILGAAVAGIFYALALGARRTAAGLGAVLVLGLGLVALHPALRHNPAESFDRLRLWQSGVRVAELFPLTGVGPVAYFRVYPAVRPPNGDLPGTFGALHPHDAYLSLAGETGIVGVVAVVFGWLRFVRAFRSRLDRLDPAGRRFALGTAAAIVAVLVQGVFDTVGVVDLAFVWIPFSGLALAAAASGVPMRREAS